MLRNHDPGDENPHPAEGGTHEFDEQDWWELRTTGRPMSREWSSWLPELMQRLMDEDPRKRAYDEVATLHHWYALPSPPEPARPK